MVGGNRRSIPEASVSSSTSRFEAVTRRAFLRTSVTAGLAAAGLAACGSGSSAGSPTTTQAGSTGGTPAGTTGATAASATTAAPATSAAPATLAPVTNPVPTTAKLTVNFTFNPSGGKMFRNPYVAVWLENGAGQLVETIAVWFDQGHNRYLRELQRWYPEVTALAAATNANSIDTITNPTQDPGPYSVIWNQDGTKAAKVGQGDYFLCIEAAREHGPYELMRGPITLAAAPATATFTDSGELTTATASYAVAG